MFRLISATAGFSNLAKVFESRRGISMLIRWDGAPHCDLGAFPFHLVGNFSPQCVLFLMLIPGVKR
jgi:hypothetical protein